MVREERLELSQVAPLEPKSSASTNSATLAKQDPASFRPGLCNTTKERNGVGDGARTHDHWNHNPGLYQLSYTHHIWITRQTTDIYSSNQIQQAPMARPAGLEPATLGLEGRCSIQLSYGRIITGSIHCPFLQPKMRNENGRSGGIRTPDPLLPKQMRYQAALHSDACISRGRE